MPFLTAAVVVVGLLCALDLILTLGVIKRLREHSELLSKRDQPALRPALPVGGEVGEFATSTVDGEPLTRDALRDTTLVAFFSPTCAPCREKLPKFVEFAKSVPGGRSRVVAGVVGKIAEADDLVRELRPVAQVVVETYDGELSAAFKTKMFPTVLLVEPDREGRPVVVDDQVNLARPLAAMA
ncbi:TlpA disulfide reductase family protein [Micromonospora sp. NPDC049559]|uniref:TlpA disulfide reductase family protein n=1 Tax=Micromonospora sp. NPDC049559 TaxID=3155923 RepID=UPI003425A731